MSNEQLIPQSVPLEDDVLVVNLDSSVATLEKRGCICTNVYCVRPVLQINICYGTPLPIHTCSCSTPITENRLKSQTQYDSISTSISTSNSIPIPVSPLFSFPNYLSPTPAHPLTPPHCSPPPSPPTFSFLTGASFLAAPSAYSFLSLLNSSLYPLTCSGTSLTSLYGPGTGCSNSQHCHPRYVASL